MSPIKIDALVSGYAGRASGFLMGKPGIYNPLKSMVRQNYFSSGRKMQYYYDLKEKNDQQYHDYKNELKKFGIAERVRIVKLHEKLTEIEKLIKDYNKVDDAKQPEKTKQLRGLILEKINQL